MRATNMISSNRRAEVQVNLYEGARFVGSAKGFLPRCGGEAEFTFTDNNLIPGNPYTYRAVVSLVAGNGTETNPTNQDVILPQVTIPEVKLFFLANIQR